MPAKSIIATTLTSDDITNHGVVRRSDQDIVVPAKSTTFTSFNIGDGEVVNKDVCIGDQDTVVLAKSTTLISFNISDGDVVCRGGKDSVVSQSQPHLHHLTLVTVMLFAGVIRTP